MDTYYEDYEVVHVLNDTSLIDSESYQRSYCCKARRLTPGYYVVTWPNHPDRRRFDDQAEFQGPFPLCVDARDVRDRLEQEARHALRPAAVAISAPLRVTAPVAQRRARVKHAPKAPVAVAISSAASQAADLLFR